MKLFLAFIKKEFFHIFRDMRTMLILLLMPIVLVILFGFAITNEIKSVPIAIVDNAKTEQSRKAIEKLGSSEYFNIKQVYTNQLSADIDLRKSDVELAVLMRNENNLEYQIIVDASDPNQATQLSQYVQFILNEPKSNLDAGVILPITHLLYNPLMKGAYNFVPGVMGLILILICAMMTSVSIVREKESGSMEVLLASPIKPIFIILSKAIPYFAISIGNIISILLLAYFLLDVPIAGSITLVFALSIIYTFVALCLGLLVSTLVETAQSAMLFSGLILMLPVILLSGMIFPIENMPYFLQVFSNIVPAKWYIDALRNLMIKGLGFESVWYQFLILFGMMLFLITLSVKRFKIRLQ